MAIKSVLHNDKGYNFGWWRSTTTTEPPLTHAPATQHHPGYLGKRTVCHRLLIRLANILVPLLVATTAIAEHVDLSLNEQVVMLPIRANGSVLQIQTTIFKPPGPGPFPLLLMNHGKTLGIPSLHKRQRYLAMSREFVRRGYAVVVPMRKGFAKSEGIYSDLGCNMADNGQLQAEDIESALSALINEVWVDKQRIIVAGESYGGLAALAFATRRFPGVVGVINFSGGLRVEDHLCDWKESLINAVASYGAQTDIPSLWFYGENDRLFDQPLANQLHETYQIAGGSSRLITFGKFKNNAHDMIFSHTGLPYWLSDVERFLAELGLPFSPMITLPEPRKKAATQFAALDDVEAVPHLSGSGRAGYREYLSKSSPRAFAISSNGAWGWAEDGDDPIERALATCQKYSRSACELYSIDNDIVWGDGNGDYRPKIAMWNHKPN